MAAGTLMHPGRHPGRNFRAPVRRGAYDQVPYIPPYLGVGEFGVATFVLMLEPGTKIGYSWETTIIRTYSGKEQRESGQSMPSIRYEGTAFLLDGGSRDVRGAIMRGIGVGATYLLALQSEELQVTADSTANVVTVASTAQSDWAKVGQRCVIVSRHGESLSVVIQQVTTTTFTVSPVNSAGYSALGVIGAAGLFGARIMPTVQVLLDPQQGFARYPVHVDLWSVRATGKLFGWAGVDSMGVGAAITTYTAGAPVPVEQLTDNDLLIWDRGNDVSGTASESLSNGAQIVNLGGAPFAFPSAPVPDWSRPIRFTSSKRDDCQWVKAFWRRCRGRQCSFLLPTYTADLVFESFATGGILIRSALQRGGGDYVSWFASLAHRRLAVTMTDGSTTYVAVTAATDNGDGTIMLAITPSFTGAVARLSFLEQVRFDNGGNNEMAMTWNGGTFSVDLTAVTTQEILSPPINRFFDKVLDLAFFYPPLPYPAGPMVATGAIGSVTLIQVTSDRSQTLTGFTATSGNVDGAVICVVNMNSASYGITCTHEDSSAPAASRFRCAGLSGVGGAAIAVWFRYDGTSQRWIELMSAT